MKIRPVGAELFHADGRTDMTALTVAFIICNCENATKIAGHCLRILQQLQKKKISVWSEARKLLNLRTVFVAWPSRSRCKLSYQLKHSYRNATQRTLHYNAFPEYHFKYYPRIFQVLWLQNESIPRCILSKFQHPLPHLPPPTIQFIESPTEHFLFNPAETVPNLPPTHKSPNIVVGLSGWTQMT